LFTQNHKPKTSLLALVLLIAACGSTAGPNPEMMRYVPEGSTFVVVLNIKELLANPSISTRIDKLKQSDDYADAKKDLGIDPFQDISFVMTAGNLKDRTGIILLAGSFDAEQVAEHMREVQRKNRESYAIEAAGPFVILGETKWVASSKSAATRGPLETSPELKAAMSNAYSWRAIFGAMSGLEKVSEMGLPEGLNPTGAAFGMEMKSGVAAEMAIHFPSSDKASQAKKIIEQEMEKAKPELASLGLSTAPSVSAVNADIIFKFMMSQEETEQGFTKFDALLRSNGL
jgi:hypothetical protein